MSVSKSTSNAPSLQATRYEIFTSADPTVTRIIPELAVEIGLNESIVLLQIAHWIKTGNNEREGKYWTFQSVREMRTKAFSYWSIDTINRAIQSLLKKGYIESRDDFNKNQYDKTRWFCLNPVRLSSLKSISIVAYTCTNGVLEPVRTLYENHTPPPQNRTTIPEITTEISTKESAVTSTATDKPKKSRPRKADTIPAERMNPMKDKIASLFQYDWQTMTKSEKGMVQRAAKQLCESGYSPDEAARIYAYCKLRYDDYTPMALCNHASKAVPRAGASAPSPLDGLKLIVATAEEVYGE